MAIQNSNLPLSFVNEVVKIVEDDTIVRSNLKNVSYVYSWIEEYGSPPYVLLVASSWQGGVPGRIMNQSHSDTYTASSVAQDNQGRVQDLGKGPVELLERHGVMDLV
ncbi:hypothetical protein AVEN_266077-1 [Araneus ventricosus]|uniref:Uncharacterized protein n=1 Tax=Araneus ventricosus TaxID=182803 RepID=A0A4Y2PEP8_ARAVE|nr:hypothetical protein AVEN_266077-1 [Araneus ventricosus]